jgi:hypothetical protein
MSNLVKSSGEKIVVAVDRANWKPVIANAMVNRQLIKDRDIGDIIGMPAEDVLKARYIKGQPLTLKLTVIFYSVKEPPFRKQNRNYFVRAIYNIPDVRREVLDWSIIKTACGGGNGYLWGRFRATSSLDNGRKMAVYGSSEEAAYNMLKQLARLSTAKITTMTVSEEKKEGLRDENLTLYKQTTRVYPGYFCLVNEKKIVGESLLENSVTGTLVGNFKRKTTPKIPLWVTAEPKSAKNLIIETLKDRSNKNDS